MIHRCLSVLLLLGCLQEKKSNWYLHCFPS